MLSRHDLSPSHTPKKHHKYFQHFDTIPHHLRKKWLSGKSSAKKTNTINERILDLKYNPTISTWDSTTFLCNCFPYSSTLLFYPTIIYNSITHCEGTLSATHNILRIPNKYLCIEVHRNSKENRANLINELQV